MTESKSNLTHKSEYRYCELRADGRSLTGTAIRYGDVAVIWGESEQFESGAFGDLSTADVILNAQHDRARPLARTGGSGLELDDTAERLQIHATLPDTAECRDVVAMVKAGVLRGLSIEFMAMDELMVGEVRTIRQAKLVGIGVVDTPAYPQSQVKARHQSPSGSWRRIWV